MEILDPANKTLYHEGDRVEVALAGNIHRIERGTICGFASSQILDHWVIKLDTKLPNLEYSCIVQQHTFIRYEGSNEKFLCEQTGIIG